MIHFERTYNCDLIKAIVTNEHVYPFVSDDYSPLPTAWEPAGPSLHWYVLVKDGGSVLGLWLFEVIRPYLWEVHTCLLPKCYGVRAREAVKVLAPWIWSNLVYVMDEKSVPVERIITRVPEGNRLAHQFALMAGLKEYGRNPKSWLKNGKLEDVILLGISRTTEEPIENEHEKQ